MAGGIAGGAAGSCLALYDSAIQGGRKLSMLHIPYLEKRVQLSGAET